MAAPVESWLDEDRWPDESIQDAIDRMISGSHVLLFVMTPGSVNRPHVV
jgi:hypothetical protein